MRRLICFLPMAWLLASCSYVQSVSKQNRLAQVQKEAPSQYIAKHLIEQHNYFVYGQLKRAAPDASRHSLAVVALSNKYQQNEIVDVNHLGKANSYYGLNLPEGEYQLLVLEDRNEDGVYSEAEVVGQSSLILDATALSEKVVGNVDIELQKLIAPVEQDLMIPVSVEQPLQQSLFFPKGSIRSLDDPLFSERMAKLGLYDPARFMEIAPMMFYALEEDTPHKVPVVFVHGIGGTAKEFQAIIEKLDRSRYKPWFFYYPSGMDLTKLAKLFYDIYLSGTVAGKGPSDIVIVAHSMGGLVVREALNFYEGNEQEVSVKLFISMASPFGGISSAQSGVDNAPLVIPAWRNLTPKGDFIVDLFRKPLPSSIEHHLVYAYRNSGDSQDGDGVVPLQSQMSMLASNAIAGRYGFKTGHAEILREVGAIDTVLSLIYRVKSPFPTDHLHYLDQGGFDMELDSSYSDFEKRMIHAVGFYLRALANGQLEPIPLNQHFLDVVQGKAQPASYVDTAWIKFREDYPGLASGRLDRGRK